MVERHQALAQRRQTNLGRRGFLTRLVSGVALGAQMGAVDVAHRHDHLARRRQRRDGGHRLGAPGNARRAVVGHREDGGHPTGYAGTFAGFSLAATTFIAGLDTARTSPVFATTFGMMLIGFLMLVAGTSIANGSPTAAQSAGTTTLSLALVLAQMCVSLGVVITWLAPVPLMEAIGCRRWPMRSSGHC